MYLRLTTILVVGFLVLGACRVAAHTNNDWLNVNGEAAIRENTDPSSANFPNSEHKLIRNLEVDEKIDYQFFADKFFELKDKQLEIVWKFPEGEFKGESVRVRMTNSGTHILQIDVFGNGEFMFTENVIYTVGKAITPPTFVVDDKAISPTEKSRTAVISRAKPVRLQVTAPNPNYKYSWDVVDKIIEGTDINHTFTNTKMPAFVILRSLDTKTNVYIDTYVRIDSEERRSAVIAPSITYVAPPNSPTTGSVVTSTDYTVAIYATIAAVVAVCAAIIFAVIKFQKRY